jgi:hypothetical protein
MTNVDGQLATAIGDWADNIGPVSSDKTRELTREMIAFLNNLDAEDFTYLLDKGLSRVYDAMTAEAPNA